jgi:hypothetical protein
MLFKKTVFESDNVGISDGGTITTTAHTLHWPIELQQKFAARCSGGKDGGQTALENAARFPLFPRTTTTGIIANGNNPSIRLLEVLT